MEVLHCCHAIAAGGSMLKIEPHYARKSSRWVGRRWVKHMPPPPHPPTPCPLTHGQWSVSSAPFLASCHGVVEGRGGGPVVCDSAGKRIIRKIFSKGETGLF